MSRERAKPAASLEDFVQSLTAQLDRAQDALALKARTGRPLTFALKDLQVDLKVFWEADDRGELSIRHAAPNEEGASTVHLSFTSITKAMVEENTISFAQEEDPRGLDEIADLESNDRRSLERLGVRTVGQLRRLSSDTDAGQMQAYLGIPVMRLRSALEAAARPAVTGTESVRRPDGPLLRIRGANLVEGGRPDVRLAGDPVEVLEAAPEGVLVRPLSHHVDGQVEVRVGGRSATGFFRLDDRVHSEDQYLRGAT